MGDDRHLYAGYENNTAAGADEPRYRAAPDPKPFSLVLRSRGREPFVNSEADYLAFGCSDHRFRKSKEQFITQKLGYRHPHIMLLAAGPALICPGVPSDEFIVDAIVKIIRKAVAITGLKDIGFFAHDAGCGGYLEDAPCILSLPLPKANQQSAQLEHLWLAKGQFLDLNVQVFYEKVNKDLGENWIDYLELVPAV